MQAENFEEKLLGHLANFCCKKSFPNAFIGNP